ncbi:hypothetical protein GQ43DRAFT_402891 [Delitschia confertaspora ATCC 74209]|uniref:Rhodopsin domain-containing protein n=1 Tax=Delitschia confertaspora ATCC 74209 TaxID=1513339 RepID=A0A9P4JDR1_9PLEO|nr:hypothetical protein GQ43DRAFT_402891 [Delitschia confertaspora ATCC 74209]
MPPPESHSGKTAVCISTTFTTLAGIIVLLRIYTRFFLVRCAGIEDYAIIFAMLCSIGLTIAIATQAHYGMGHHIAELEDSDMINSLKAFWGSLIMYYLALGTTKSSILLQYNRVFQTKKFRLTCNLVLLAVIVYSIWTVFGSIFACYPIKAFWTKERATCIDQFAMWFTNAGINILTDLVIIILPMPVIRRLNLAKKQKGALIGIFAVGGFVCIVSILRLQSLISISNSWDPTYDNPPAATWSSVETNVGIICSCLPCLRPLVAKFFPKVFASYQGTSTGPLPRSTAYGQRSAAWRSVNLEPIGSNTRVETEEDGIHVMTTVKVSVELEDKDMEKRERQVGFADMLESSRIESRRGREESNASTETLVPSKGKL